MNPLNIIMAQRDIFFNTNEKDPTLPYAPLNFSFMSSIQIVPGLPYHHTWYLFDQGCNYTFICWGKVILNYILVTTIYRWNFELKDGLTYITLV